MLKGLCQLFGIFVKKLHGVFASIEFQNNGLVLLLKTIYMTALKLFLVVYLLRAARMEMD